MNKQSSNGQKMTRRVINKMVQEVMANREEITRAFIAKWGFEPDECQQVQEDNKWFLIRLPNDKIERVARSIVMARLSARKLSRWQKLCLRMAGLLNTEHGGRGEPAHAVVKPS